MYPTVSVTEARRNFGKLLDRVERGERIVITRYGKPFVALVSMRDFKFLIQPRKLRNSRSR
jgi:prevent-host-death family protein